MRILSLNDALLDDPRDVPLIESIDLRLLNAEHLDASTDHFRYPLNEYMATLSPALIFVLVFGLKLHNVCQEYERLATVLAR